MFNFTDKVVTVELNYDYSKPNEFQMMVSPEGDELILVFPKDFDWVQRDTIEILATNGSIALVNKDWLARQA